MLLVATDLAKNESAAFSARLNRRLIGKVGEEIANAGAGRCMPEFKQSTRQRTQPKKSTAGTKLNDRA
jgi:hypothetical protein